MVVEKNTSIAMEKILPLTNFLLLLVFFVSCKYSYLPEEVSFSHDTLFISETGKPLSGFVRTYYENKQLQSVKTYRNGIPNGYYLRFFLNKQLSLKMYYENGKPLYFIQYFEDGKIKARQYDSIGYQWITRYNEKGILIEKQQLKNSLLVGNVYQFYDNGKIKAIIPYKNGKKHGVFKMFFPDGKLQIIGHFENDTLHGLIKSWNIDGMFAEEFYNKGKRTGIWKYYYPGGQLKTTLSFTEIGTVKERVDYDSTGKIINKFTFLTYD